MYRAAFFPECRYQNSECCLACLSVLLLFNDCIQYDSITSYNKPSTLFAWMMNFSLVFHNLCNTMFCTPPRCPGCKARQAVKVAHFTTHRTAACHTPSQFTTLARRILLSSFSRRPKRRVDCGLGHDVPPGTGRCGAVELVPAGAGALPGRWLLAGC